MPDGRVSPENALALKEAGFEMLHFSAIKKDVPSQNDDLFSVKISGVSDKATILKIKKILNI